MRVILDSNILFSALIKDSITRRLILEYKGYFLFPEFIFEEMEKHKGELLTKSAMDKEDFDELLSMILQKVVIIPNERLLPYRLEALEIVKDIDINDVIFMACAIAYPGSIIWSDDKNLKRQTKVTVKSTKDIIQTLRTFKNRNF